MLFSAGIVTNPQTSELETEAKDIDNLDQSINNKKKKRGWPFHYIFRVIFILSIGLHVPTKF